MLNFLKTWFGGKKSAQSSKPQRRSFRPTVEAFEERLVPATLTVTNPLDNGAAGTLRYELNQANTDASHGVSDTIQFASNLRGDTITLSRGVLELKATGPYAGVTINGGGAITISGANSTQVFEVDSGAYDTLENLNIKDGKAFDGGAVYNGGNLSVYNCDMYDNTGSYGGAIENSGVLSVSSSTFGSNSASVQGGAIWNSGTLNASNTEFAYDTAVYGGAIMNTNMLESVQSCSFVANDATVSGGAIYNQGWAFVNQSTFNSNSAQYGGGIFSQGTVTFDNSTFLDNHASHFGGGFYHYSGAYSWSGITWEGNSAGTTSTSNYSV